MPYKHAKQLAEENLRINPRDADLQISIATYTAELGDKKKAVSLIQEALKLKPDAPHTLFRLAVFYEFQLGDNDAALNWLTKAVNRGQTWREIDHSPSLTKLRQDPRFQQLRDRGDASTH